MTYRDDHDAAIARADALEAELARTKAELDDARKVRRDPDGPYVRSEPVTIPPRSDAARIAIGLFLLLAVGVVGAIIKASRNEPTPAPPSQWSEPIMFSAEMNPVCRVTSTPSNVEVYAITVVNGQDMMPRLLGVTPFDTRTVETMGAFLEARRDGRTSERRKLPAGPACDVHLQLAY